METFGIPANDLAFFLLWRAKCGFFLWGESLT